MIHRHQTFHCPKCRKPLNAATQVQGSKSRPRKGDLTVCYGCTSWLVFTGPCSARLMTNAEKERLDPMTQKLAARAEMNGAIVQSLLTHRH